MTILRHGKHHVPKQDHDPAIDITDYDAQIDLALATPDHELAPGDVATPYAGSVVPATQGPGYDVERDVCP
jgi:hypothetical protein